MIKELIHVLKDGDRNKKTLNESKHGLLNKEALSMTVFFGLLRLCCVSVLVSYT